MKNFLRIFTINFLIISVCQNYRLIMKEELTIPYAFLVTALCIIGILAFYKEK